MYMSLIVAKLWRYLSKSFSFVFVKPQNYTSNLKTYNNILIFDWFKRPRISDEETRWNRELLICLSIINCLAFLIELESLCCRCRRYSRWSGRCHLGWCRAGRLLAHCCRCIRASARIVTSCDFTSGTTLILSCWNKWCRRHYFVNLKEKQAIHKKSNLLCSTLIQKSYLPLIFHSKFNT